MFFNGISRFVVFFIIFGLWTSWKKIQYNNLLRIYAIFPLIGTIVNFASLMFFDKLYKFITLSNTVANVTLIFIGLTHLIIACETIFTSQAQKRIIDNFSFVDQMFATKLNIKSSYQKDNRCIFIHTLILTSITIFMHLSVTAYLVYGQKIYNFLYNASFSNTIIVFRQIEVFFFVYSIQIRLCLINSKLREFQNVSLIDSDQTENFIFDQMLYLKQILRKLSNICDLINIAFGWSLLLSTINILTKVTISFYWAYLDLPDVVNLIVNFCMISPKLLTFFTLAFYCSSCSQNVIYQYLEKRNE